MRVTVITIVVGALRIVSLGVKRGLEELEIIERIDTIQNTSLLRSTKILRRVLET